MLDKRLRVWYAFSRRQFSMPTPKHLHGIKGDECQCGRRQSVRHCPECGSPRKYAYSSPQYRERPSEDGGKPVYEKVQLYRCIDCNYKYTDAEREFCGAPPIGKALAHQKVLALAEQIKVDSDIPKSVQKLVDEVKPATPKTPQEAYQEFKRQELMYRQLYADEVYELKQRGKEHDLTEREFVDRYLASQNITRLEDPDDSR